MYTGSVLTIFKQYTLNGKRRVSNGKRHVIKRKQTRLRFVLERKYPIIPHIGAEHLNAHALIPELFEISARPMATEIVF